MRWGVREISVFREAEIAPALWRKGKLNRGGLVHLDATVVWRCGALHTSTYFSSMLLFRGVGEHLSPQIVLMYFPYTRK